MPMNHFVNECLYTPQVISEAIGAWWDKRLRSDLWKFLLLMVLILAGSILTDNYYLLFMELLPVLILALYKYKARQSIRTEKERLKVIFQEETPVYYVEIGEDIYYKTPKSENRVQFSDLLDARETKSLIVLFLKGSMTLTMSKTGFKEGNYKDCLAYLKTRIKK